MNAQRLALWWSIPASLFAADVLAWGLYTHVYFAQLLVWAVPLLDPALRRAVRRFPQRLMAGACLPDLALVGSTARTRAFDASHRWETAHALLDAAHDDETRACAVGAISHLWVDIIAHNHFVPAHEHLWWNVPMLTHAASEWAMDRHIARHLFRPPATLLQADGWLVDYVARNFGCTPAAGRRAVRRFPQRLMAGACLPDLALVGSTARTRAFDASHRWETAHALLDAAHDDETRACAVGAISHLWVDIIAHNHFVPAHEHLWWNVPMLTHAASEWAMDRHIARHLFRPPATLLQADGWLVDYVARNFGCTPAAGRRAIRQLAGAEALLRHSRLPNMLHGMGRVLDRRLAARFDYYIQEVTT
ncbi:MAG: zinc dependent phospholipase C family protein, partial [Candidatus Thermoplasmatota archaeon]|nr:zinc dependent phospholipase C family protein [Candidatus Thermoplasmatota archaeon]